MMRFHIRFWVLFGLLLVFAAEGLASYPEQVNDNGNPFVSLDGIQDIYSKIYYDETKIGSQYEIRDDESDEPLQVRRTYANGISEKRHLEIIARMDQRWLDAATRFNLDFTPLLGTEPDAILAESRVSWYQNYWKEYYTITDWKSEMQNAELRAQLNSILQRVLSDEGQVLVFTNQYQNRAPFSRIYGETSTSGEASDRKDELMELLYEYIVPGDVISDIAEIEDRVAIQNAETRPESIRQKDIEFLGRRLRSILREKEMRSLRFSFDEIARLAEGQITTLGGGDKDDIVSDSPFNAISSLQTALVDRFQDMYEKERAYLILENRIARKNTLETMFMNGSLEDSFFDVVETLYRWDVLLHGEDYAVVHEPAFSFNQPEGDETMDFILDDEDWQDQTSPPSDKADSFGDEAASIAGNVYGLTKSADKMSQTVMMTNCIPKSVFEYPQIEIFPRGNCMGDIDTFSEFTYDTNAVTELSTSQEVEPSQMFGGDIASLLFAAECTDLNLENLEGSSFENISTFGACDQINADEFEARIEQLGFLVDAAEQALWREQLAQSITVMQMDADSFLGQQEQWKDVSDCLNNKPVKQ